MMKPIVVYSLPPQLLTSPYLDQLYGPMASLGIHVQRGRPRREVPRLLLGRGTRVLHLHFFDELTQQPSLIQTVLRSVLFLSTLALLRLRGVRLVWTAHNLQPHETYHPLWGFVVYRAVSRMSDAVIAHSHAAKAMLESRYGLLQHCTVIPHGSYVGLYGTRQDKQRSRATLGIPQDGFVALNLGTLRPYKGLELLLEAWRGLPGRLIIAGQAKDQAYAATLAAQAEATAGVEFRPAFVPDAALPTWLGSADVLVLPYRQLLTSGMLLWALSYGVPVVAPDVAPVRELIADGDTGFLFRPNDVGSLRAALERAQHAPDLAAQSAAAYAVAQDFDWARIAERTAMLYRHVVSGSCSEEG